MVDAHEEPLARRVDESCHDMDCFLSTLVPVRRHTMRPRNILAFSISVILAAPLVAQTPGAAKVSKAPQASQPVFTAAADLKWTDLDPKGAPGVKVATLWGDPAKGAFGAYFKLPAGFAVPLHTHTNAMKVVFISGTYIQAPEGKSEVRLGPGSYMMQPGGNYRHTTSCDKASDCVFFVESSGKFDLKPVETGKPPAKE
jgi:anti-sigma factor ChrR (cupin superfamily)